MNTQTHQPNTKLLRITIITLIISTTITAIQLQKLNNIVHTQLYNYGLQFNLTWATPYWDTERWIYATLAGPTIMGTIALIHSLLDTRTKNKNKIPPKRRTEPQPTPNTTKPTQTETKPTAGPTPVKTTRVDNVMVITCPKCRKDFGTPLNMLDFSKGTAQLVNVCPYCNYILGSAVEDASGSTKVILPDRTEIEQK